MKRIVIGMLMLTFLYGIGSALPKQKFETMEQRVAFARKNIEAGLRSDNAGVIDGCMMMTAKIGLTLPDLRIPELLALVDSIASRSDDPQLRYKAFVVLNICSDPDWFTEEPLLSINESDLFYYTAGRRLQQKMLGLSLR